MLETKGRANILKEFSVNFTKPVACKACGRTKDLKTIYIKQGAQSYNELCYCQSCWNQIFNEIIKEDN